MLENFVALLTGLEAAFDPSNPEAYLILFALVMVADIGIPIPFIIDTVLIFASFNVFYADTVSMTEVLPVILIVITLLAGRHVGSGILYILARKAGGPFLNWLQRRFPSMVKNLELFKTRLARMAPLAVTTCRLTPGLLQITSVAAGAMCLRYSYFAVGITVSSLIYDGILIALGLIAANSPKADDINFTFWLLISLVIVVCILWPLIFVFIRRKSRDAKNNS